MGAFASPLQAFSAALLVDRNQTAAEIVGFLGKAAVDLRDKDCPGPFHLALLAKGDYFFSSRFELLPRPFQKQQVLFFFFFFLRIGNGIADRRDPVVEARLQCAELLFPGRIALVKKIGGNQVIAFQERDLRFLGADPMAILLAGQVQANMDSPRGKPGHKGTPNCERDDPQDRQGEPCC